VSEGAKDLAFGLATITFLIHEKDGTIVHADFSSFAEMRPSFGTHPIDVPNQDGVSSNFLNAILPTKERTTIVDSNKKFFNVSGCARRVGFRHIDGSNLWSDDVWVMDLDRPVDEDESDGSFAHHNSGGACAAMIISMILGCVVAMFA